jgi:hypothetical protein
MREVSNPVAIARIRWLDPARHPAPGSTMGATAVFVLGNDAEVIPRWPAAGKHFSILLTFTDALIGTEETEAKVDFLDREAVANYLREGATLLIMAGPQPIAEAQITRLLWKPDP